MGRLLRLLRHAPRGGLEACYDLSYLKRRSLLFDVLILIETASSVVLPGPAARPNERFIAGIEAVQELGSVKTA